MKSKMIVWMTAALMCACGHRDLQPLPRELNSAYQPAFDSVFPDVNGVSTSDLHSLMVVQNGKVVYERYGIDHSVNEQHILWSATKTFTALAAGFAIQDGVLGLQTPLMAYLTEDELALPHSDTLRGVTIEHLLKMTSGWEKDVFTTRIRGGEKFNPIAEMIQYPFDAEPGTRWRYNNIDTYMLGVAVSRSIGMSLEDYLNLRLFTPLGIRCFTYERDYVGNNPAAFGLHMTTESMAKVGQFMLQKGQWKGKQLLSPEWIDAMMQTQVMQYPDRQFDHPTDWQSGYGYQMWKCREGQTARMDGMWGQYVIVMPEKNSVCVMTTICTDRSAQMESFWRHIYTNLPMQ